MTPVLQAPEQTLAEVEEELITTAGSALREDEVFSVLSELATVSKVRYEPGNSGQEASALWLAPPRVPCP